jgi:two-component system, cell cycle sensor histidine kinase and response regulator CckA
VLGFGELVLKALGAGHQQSGDVNAMVGAADKAAWISRQLLAFSRQLPMVHREVDLAQLLKELGPQLAELLGPEQSLVVRPSTALDFRVRADPRQLEQVLIQLTRNAGDAMRAGGELTIALDRAELTPADALGHPADDVIPGSYVLLEASDNGCGMDSVTLRRAFEPFFTTKPFGEGTGLGLAMTHGIVKQHGGQVWALSEVGKGTTIRVFLPGLEASAKTSRPE